jgi:hypothetical protein
VPRDDDEKIKEIERFLADLRECLFENQKFRIIERKKNQDTLIQLGLTRRNLVDELISLSINNYCSGPEQDDRRQTDVLWEFGKEIEGAEIYIKLKIFTVNGEDYVKLISFHQAEFPVKHPYL